MAIVNHTYSLYNESCESSLEKHIGWGCDFMRSNKEKPMRNHVDLAEIRKRS